MQIHFCTPSEFDLNAFRLMGISAKPESTSPIGYFGTGLKYAVATLLRTGHSVTLRLDDGTVLPFTSREITFRGETHRPIFMGEEQLGFTIDLGKNWKPWMAYRELESNTRDEFGHTLLAPTLPSYSGTVITVEGVEIIRAYERRNDIFLTGEPLATYAEVEVYDRPSQHYYYRGVVVGQWRSPSPFTYNITEGCRLTEDRTVAVAAFESTLEQLLPRIPNADIARACLVGADDRPEARFYFDFCLEPEEEWKTVIKTARIRHPRENEITRKWLPRADTAPQPLTITPAHEGIIALAFEKLAPLNIDLEPSHVFWAKNGLKPVYGFVKDGQIYITERGLEMGATHLAATLYEEYLHKTVGVTDCTREMQDLLFQKVVALCDDLRDAHG